MALPRLLLAAARKVEDQITDLAISVVRAALNTTILQLESIKAAPSWVAVVAFANSWVNYDTSATTSWYPAAYSKDALGYVRLRGTVKNGGAPGAGTAMFTLPAGYRPTKVHSWAMDSNTGFASVSVQSTGNVAWNSGGLGYMYLDGITFLAEI